MTNLSCRHILTHNVVCDVACHVYFVINVSAFGVINMNMLLSHLLVRGELLLT
jgi:hypothetical protein